jgi:hypothetical protein
MFMREVTLRNSAVWGVGICLLSLTGSVQGATTIISDLTAGGKATINQAIFATKLFQPSGTGVIDPFIRLQSAGNNTYEAAYNTSLGTPLDTLSNGKAWHTDLALSSLQSVNVDGIDYYDFRLDLGEPGAPGKSKISLNQVQIFGSANKAPASGVGMDGSTGRATSANLLGTPIYDMNSSGAPIGHEVLLDGKLNSGGNGKGDMELLVPKALFGNLQYVVFYSEFGSGPIPGGTAAEGTFEEWAAVTSAVVPEPTTIIAGALLLVPFGVSTLRQVRRNRSGK